MTVRILTPCAPAEETHFLLVNREICLVLFPEYFSFKNEQQSLWWDVHVIPANSILHVTLPAFVVTWHLGLPLSWDLTSASDHVEWGEASPPPLSPALFCHVGPCEDRSPSLCWPWGLKWDHKPPCPDLPRKTPHFWLPVLVCLTLEMDTLCAGSTFIFICLCYTFDVICKLRTLFLRVLFIPPSTSRH